MRAALLLILLATLRLPALGQVGLRGFLTKDIPAEEKFEQQAQAASDPAHLRKYMEFLAAEPHHAGSARSKVVAEFLQSSLKEFGLEAHIEEFEGLIPFPTIRELEVLGPNRYTAKLKEPPVQQDPSSADAAQLPTFNAYGASGEVSGDVVYVNFGVPEDYDWLSRQGIEVKGKIVIARYGRSWRGIKPKVAAEHGAIACLIYSDPHEDGYFEGEVYPNGPMRPQDGVQRGSVLDMPLYPGDPLSPGWPSENGSRRLPLAEAKSLPSIPVLPLSYGDAQPILEQLTGPLVPREWRGALAITYHAGPGPTRVRLKTNYDWSVRPLYNVIATIPGSQAPDEWIIAGNHHDAWVTGAEDPVSGAAALLETSRSLALLLSRGWKPARTIKIAWWDGEEFGLLGSTEWVEKHQDELREKAVAYLNSDNTSKGWIHIGASHTLEAFAEEVASAVTQPGTSLNLIDALLQHPAGEDSEDEPSPPKRRAAFAASPLGAGSDYVAFLDYLGVASMNAGFSGAVRSGVYHSAYDSLYWYTHFSDSTFADGRALAQYTSTALMRLADASVLPFEFGRLAATISFYVDDIQRQAQRGTQRLNFNGLLRELDDLKLNSDKFDALLEAAALKNTLNPLRLAAVNQALLRSERALTRPEGLPNRSWYKHQIYAPGFYTGYAVKTLPGVREAVDAKDWTLARKQADLVQQCLANLNQLVSKAIIDLAGI
jgi:N-acetylated-alpha-linked acidic dipeptidase